MESLVEGVGLPVVGVVGELNVTLDVWRQRSLVSEVVFWFSFVGYKASVASCSKDLPMSMCFNPVRSKAVPMTYVVPSGNKTCPPSLHFFTACKIYDESSVLKSL